MCDEINHADLYYFPFRCRSRVADEGSGNARITEYIGFNGNYMDYREYVNGSQLDKDTSC